MPWLQLSLVTAKDQAPVIESLLQDLGALSITFGDAAGQMLLEPAPGQITLWRDIRITALFENETDPHLLQTAVRNAAWEEPLHELEVHTLADRIWERAWLEDFHPMRFGRRLWVCPAGQRPDQRDAVPVDLDPGLAFGTGTHPTTALCLRWLDGAALTGKRVLDYGCGSGILAISAAMLGAESVTAVDCDPQALESTRNNAERNAMHDRIITLPPEQIPNETFDVALANILAGTLIELAPQLRARISANGQLSLSGILSEQVESVKAAYCNAFDFAPPVFDGEWALLHGHRNMA